ncbi:MAG TPA: SDR family NAD(P)-dependent oxidoreductase [Candidatus Kapabacteria bacterium]|nr:SDR family NAD(P)-dependent oxidoreductase [Candidatus Kapabacteria bacterium]
MNIVITGASKGIGLAIAEKFSQDNEKHSFVLCSRSAHNINNAAEQLRKNYPLHAYHTIACDVGDEQQVLAFAKFCKETLDSTDILVNNAGFGIFKPVVEFSLNEFQSVLDTNLRGVFLVTRELLPPMRAKKSGTIITIASLAAKNGFSGGAAYCASKYAVRGLMNCLFLEVRNDNIRCITIFPGSVDTAFYDNVPSSIAKAKMLLASEIAESVWSATHLPIGATVSEIDIRPTNPKG